MGVPKFFRWLAERYPLVVNSLAEPHPVVDNLYLDMNGIIHVCCRSERIQLGENESHNFEQMVRCIYGYLESIFASVRPRKRFFLAVDGVAPRAKLNQQRQRRYRKVSESSGLDIGDAFDSNCITPGTQFMIKLSSSIEYFITHKISTNAAWRLCDVIYSSHRDPGEGEHKIMDFIRRNKSDPAFQGEAHCLYGLDADLIMLALSTHMPNFILLRENVTFGSHWKEKKQVEDMQLKGIEENKAMKMPSKFVLLHIDTLRQYLSIEIQPKDLKASINDFIFLCFLLGNDFLPGLPGLSIPDGAIPKLLEIYASTCIQRHQQLLDGNRVNASALKDIISKIAEIEWELIKNKNASAKKGQREEVIGALSHAKTLAEYKRVYYAEKLKFTERSEVLELANAYVEGLMWVFQYYFEGCPDWGWYYRYHYAPLASDVIEAIGIVDNLSFEKGQPFTPYEQLLAVLPLESYRCMPKTMQNIVTDSKAVALRETFFPKICEIAIDREGCRAEWEGVMLLPFINAGNLKAEFAKMAVRLTDEEKFFNSSESAVIYRYDIEQKLNFSLDAPIKNFPSLHCHHVLKVACNVHQSLQNDNEISSTPFKELASSFKIFERDLVIQKTSKETQVFGQLSRNPSIVIDLSKRKICLEELKICVGQVISVGFPYFKKALLVSIYDENHVVVGDLSADDDMKQMHTKALSPDERSAFCARSQKVTAECLMACGIRLQKTQPLVHVRHLIGETITLEGESKRLYQTNESVYPVQLCIPECTLPANLSKGMSLHLQEKVGVFVPKFGFQSDLPSGVVGKIVETQSSPKKRLCMAFPEFLLVHDALFYQSLTLAVRSLATVKGWTPSIELCHQLKIPHKMLFTISGSLRCDAPGETLQIGLQLVDQKHNLVQPGFVRCVKPELYKTALSNPIVPSIELDKSLAPSENDGKKVWLFSNSAVKVMKQYLKHVEWLSDILRKEHSSCVTLEKEFSNNADDTALEKAISEAKQLQTLILQSRCCTGKTIAASKPKLSRADEIAIPRQVVSDIEKILKESSVRVPVPSETLHDLPAQYVFVPIIESTEVGCSQLRPCADMHHPSNILQRVVFCGTSGPVAFGARGCVTRMSHNRDYAEVVFDDEFLECDDLGGCLESYRGAMLSVRDLLVIASVDNAYGKHQKIATQQKSKKAISPKPKKQQSQSSDPFDKLKNLEISPKSDGCIRKEQKYARPATCKPMGATNDGKKSWKERRASSNDGKNTSIKEIYGRVFNERSTEKTSSQCLFGESCMISDRDHLERFHGRS